MNEFKNVLFRKTDKLYDSVGLGHFDSVVRTNLAESDAVACDESRFVDLKRPIEQAEENDGRTCSVCEQTGVTTIASRFCVTTGPPAERL